MSMMAPYPDRTAIDRIAGVAAYKEIAFQRMLGEGWETAYRRGWQVLDDIYDLAAAPDRPLITMGLRRIQT